MSTTIDTHSILMKAKSGQKTAIIVGMLIKLEISLENLDTDRPLYQVRVLVE